MKRFMLSILVISFFNLEPLRAMKDMEMSAQTDQRIHTITMPKEKMASMNMSEEKNGDETRELQTNELSDETQKKFLEEYLFVSSAAGDTARMKDLIEEDKISPNIIDEAGNTPLHFAKDLATVKLLIEKGADINAQNKAGIARLHIDVFSGHFLILDYLLKQPSINVKVATTNGVTPLHLAVQMSYFSDPEMAVEAIKDNKAIPQAFSVSNVLGKFILGAGALALLQAAFRPLGRATTVLKSKFLSLPLWKASYDVAYANKLKAVGDAASQYEKAFTAFGAEGAGTAEAAAFQTAETNFNTAIAEANKFGAAKAGLLSVVPTALAVTGAIIAAIVGVDITLRNMVVGALLKHGADANAQDSKGNTPLHTLAVGPIVSIVKRQGGLIMAFQLLSNGAENSLTIKNKMKQTPYDVAVEYDRIPLAALLAPDDDSARKAFVGLMVAPVTLTVKEVKKAGQYIKNALPTLWGKP